MQIHSDLALSRDERLEQAFAEASTAASYGYDDPPRRRGRVVRAYAWAVEFPTKREASWALRKLRQGGYRRRRAVSLDRPSQRRVHLQRWRKKLRADQAELESYLWSEHGVVPF